MDRATMATATARIREALRAEERSQRWLARRLGVSGPRVNRVLAGQDGLTPAFLARVAAALGTTPEALLAEAEPERVEAVS